MKKILCTALLLVFLFGCAVACTPDGELPEGSEPKKLATVKRDGWIFLSDYSVYYQTSASNSGPACAQSVLEYINGTAPMLATAELGCLTTEGGTYLANVADYLNTLQNQRFYDTAFEYSFDTMLHALRRAVEVKKVPAVLAVSCATGKNWRFNSNGSFCCVYGLREDLSAFCISAPSVGYMGSAEPIYYADAAPLYRASVIKNVGIAY